MTGRSYDAKFADRTLRVWTDEVPDDKLEQFQVAVKESSLTAKSLASPGAAP
jgi:uncharacterized protein YbaA (DUF1428 family)